MSTNFMQANPRTASCGVPFHLFSFSVEYGLVGGKEFDYYCSMSNGTVEKSRNVNIHHADCVEWLKHAQEDSIDVSFLDPPFNQGKDYRHFDDNQDQDAYWAWMQNILSLLYHATAEGGWVYFMQREKNAEFVLRAMREAGWNFKNLIVWKKMTSAVPSSYKFGLHYQIIAAAVKGRSARLFNRLRISPPLLPNYKHQRENGIYVTDLWDDIRELTSGYFAGKETVRTGEGVRFHKQQAPLALLTRIILSSSMPGDVVFDPFAGTGTTAVAAMLLNRKAIGVEVDEMNVRCIKERCFTPCEADIETMNALRNDYLCTKELSSIWGDELTGDLVPEAASRTSDTELFVR